MGMKPGKSIWMSGRWVAWEDATLHVLSHVVHYGSSVFEGIRCYETPAGPAVFRLQEHVRRLFESARIYRMDVPFGTDEIVQVCLDAVGRNDLRACYLRPLIYRGFGSMGVNPLPCPVEVLVAAWEWGAYLGEEALENGVDVQVSTWCRLAPNTMPALAKAGANYANSQLVKMEALSNGYAEGIVLDVDGFACEGSGENLFVVRDGIAHTPPVGSSILAGLTRASAITLLEEMDVPVVQDRIPREYLYLADEVFFTGTAAEITPIRSVDRIPVGSGKPGEITRRVQRALLEILTGEAEDRFGWLRRV